MRIFLLIVVSTGMLFGTGCQNDPTEVKYYSLKDLENQEKFRGYNLCEGPPEGMEGPWRVVPGVNYTVRREAMTPLWRELDFDDKRWVFKHDDSVGWGFRFLALGNPNGDVCAVMLKSDVEVPTYLETKGDGPRGQARKHHTELEGYGDEKSDD